MESVFFLRRTDPGERNCGSLIFILKTRGNRLSYRRNCGGTNEMLSLELLVSCANAYSGESSRFEPVEDVFASWEKAALMCNEY